MNVEVTITTTGKAYVKADIDSLSVLHPLADQLAELHGVYLAAVEVCKGSQEDRTPVGGSGKKTVIEQVDALQDEVDNPPQRYKFEIVTEEN